MSSAVNYSNGIQTQRTRIATVAAFKSAMTPRALENPTNDLKQLESAIINFLTHDPLITGQRMAVFLYIARRDEDSEGCTIKDVYKNLGLTQVSTYKHLKFLSAPEDYGEKRALGLVRVEEVLDPRPIKKLSLTPKGRKFIESLKRAA